MSNKSIWLNRSNYTEKMCKLEVKFMIDNYWKNNSIRSFFS